jgi:hypothetical protein
MAKFVNISGKVYVDTIEYGMLTVSDYNDVSKLVTIPPLAPVTRSTTELDPLQNGGPEMTKEEVLNMAISYLTKYIEDTYHDIPFGSKYNDDRGFLLEGLRSAFPQRKWYVKGRNATQFIYRGHIESTSQVDGSA